LAWTGICGDFVNSRLCSAAQPVSISSLGLIKECAVSKS
jgi:hypothetical protein